MISDYLIDDEKCNLYHIFIAEQAPSNLGGTPSDFPGNHDLIYDYMMYKRYNSCELIFFFHIFIVEQAHSNLGGTPSDFPGNLWPYSLYSARHASLPESGAV